MFSLSIYIFFSPLCLCFLWMLSNYHIYILLLIFSHSSPLPWFIFLSHCTSLILTLVSVFVSLILLVSLLNISHLEYLSHLRPLSFSSSLFPLLLTVNLSICHCHLSLLSLLKFALSSLLCRPLSFLCFSSSALSYRLTLSFS